MDPSASAISRRTALRSALVLAALAGVPSVAGCGSSTASRGGPTGPALQPVALIKPRQAVAIDAVGNLPAVVAGLRHFAGAFYDTTAARAVNWTASPLSLEIAFGMLRAGARGSSARALDTVFGFPATADPSGSPHAALNALTRGLVTPEAAATAPPTNSPGYSGPPPIVAVANGLFVDQTYVAQLQKAFLTVLATQYGASPTAVSFASPSAAALINAWVRTQTRDRITKLFDQIDPATELILANAVYFKAAWGQPFPVTNTVPGPFTSAAGAVVRPQMMRQSIEQAPYRSTAAWQRVTLPYLGGGLTMRIVVPTGSPSDRAALSTAVAAATEPTPRDAPAPIDLTVPRWTSTTNLSLNAPLKSLGLADLFDQRADLSGIGPGLFVSDAVHRATITVDEQGSEAAAVTGIGIATSGSVGPPTEVRVDRPFAWAIMHEPTGAPVFTGHVTDPTAG